MATPEKAVLVGDWHLFPNGALLADQGWPGAERVKRYVNVEGGSERVITQDLGITANEARIESSAPTRDSP
jgi:hypothetical protein